MAVQAVEVDSSRCSMGRNVLMAKPRGAKDGDEASTHFKIGHMEPKPQSLNLKHESFVHYKCFMLESNSALNP